MSEDRSAVERDERLVEDNSVRGGAADHDPSDRVLYEHRTATEAPKMDGKHRLKMPSAGQLLAATFGERRCLLSPWLREHENCMVYAASGVGKSLFALSLQPWRSLGTVSFSVGVLIPHLRVANGASFT
jgi:hypothetical protein